MNFSELSNQIFDKCIDNYHLTDDVDAPINNPYELRSIEFYLYLKNWIDTVQWHLEDIIRNPEIEPGRNPHGQCLCGIGRAHRGGAGLRYQL